MKQLTADVLVPIGISVIQQILNVLNVGIHPSHSKQFIDNLCQNLVVEANKILAENSPSSDPATVEAPPNDAGV